MKKVPTFCTLQQIFNFIDALLVRNFGTEFWHSVKRKRSNVTSPLNHDRFSEWQVKHGRVSVLQIRVIVNNVKIVIEELSYLEKCLIPVLNNVFDKATAEEWIGTYLQPIMKKLIGKRNF